MHSPPPGWTPTSRSSQVEVLPRLSGSRLTFSGTGSVTVRSGQAGNSTYAPANPVSRTFLVKRPLKLVFDAIGDMGRGQNFTVRAVVLDGITNKPVQVTPTYSIVSGPATVNGSQITCGSTTGTVQVRAVATGSVVLYQFGYGFL